MRLRLTYALAATAALALAACNSEPNAPDDRIVDTAEADPDAIDVELPEVPVETPTVSTTGPDDSAQETPEE